MSTFVLEGKRPDESDADYEARAQAHWRKVAEAAASLQRLRDRHTARMGGQQPEERRSVA